MPIMDFFTHQHWRNKSPTANWLRPVKLLALIFVVFFVGPVSAKDLAALGQLLTPAYTAMSIAGLCKMDPGWVTTEPRGKRGTAINYAEHIKDEAIESLTYGDAVVVLKLAAGAAIAEARKQLKDNVISQDKAAEALRFKTWCHDYVTPFILALITKHDGDHTLFLAQFDLAKRDREP